MNIKLSVVCLVLTLLTSALTARARLNETPAQIEQRLGSPVETSIEESPFGPVGACTFKAFSKNGVRCDVYFLAGKSVAEFYQKETNADFADGEIQSLLDVNASGSTWDKSLRASLPHYWDRADHGAAASYNEANGKDVAHTRLAIQTPAFDAEMDRAEKAKAAKRIEGF